MERYNYHDAVCEDIRSYIADNDIEVNEDNRDEVEERLNDELGVADSVTGNGSGSYTFSAWQAEENLCLLGEALDEFGCSPDYMAKNGAEACDVTIRCYLLGQCLSEVLDEIIDNQ